MSGIRICWSRLCGLYLDTPRLCLVCVQCSGSNGVCSDTAQGGQDDLTVKSKSYTDGIVDVVYARKLDTGTTAGPLRPLRLPHMPFTVGV